jgi:hypothetical protein
MIFYGSRYAVFKGQRLRALQQNTCRFLERVTMAAGIHLFPFRTEKLSPPAPMVLRGRPRGRVGRRPFFMPRFGLYGLSRDDVGAACG